MTLDAPGGLKSNFNSVFFNELPQIIATWFFLLESFTNLIFKNIYSLNILIIKLRSKFYTKIKSAYVKAFFKKEKKRST